MFEAASFAIIFTVSWLGVALFRRWSRRRDLFDVPNERSSHTAPTPRGGGIIIAAVSLIAYTAEGVGRSGRISWSYLAGAILIAGISWLDDLYSISFLWRFLVHSAAAVLVIAALGHFDEIAFSTLGGVRLGAFFGAVLTFLWIVWLTNAYNFMDGIDGIAGLQAVIAGLGWLAIGKLSGGGGDSAFYGGALAFASLGFLIQNWQPAKIFMGDVGSAFLGFSFAVLPLLAHREWDAAAKSEYRTYLPLIGVGLVWLFVFDTVITFFRRALNGEKVWQAHRGHFYQRLVIRGFSHQAVALFYGLISLISIILMIWTLFGTE